MNINSKLRRIRWGWVVILAVFFALMFGVSALFGDSVRGACFWAIIVNAIAAGGGAAPVVYAVAFRPSVQAYYLLVAGTIRLLLAAAGSSIILIFVKVNVLWFVASVGIMYATVLALEVCFFVKTMAECDKADKN